VAVQPPEGYTLRPATPADAKAITKLVKASYREYVPVFGIVPRPMRDDYFKVIAERQVTVAEHDGEPAGVLVLGPADEGFCLDNIAVHPTHRGSGLGATLLGLAESEATRAGHDSIYLYTHERATELQATYARRGYVEYARRPRGDFSLVYMRKRL
jgi:GNAT superfamily N-acetyltransferase